MITISSIVSVLRIRKATGSDMSPLYSVDLLSGVATKMSTAGVITPFVGNAVLWVKDPAGALTQNTVACASPNGAWSYANANTKPGTWTAALHVPSSTGILATASADYTWEVDSSIATAQ